MKEFSRVQVKSDETEIKPPARTVPFRAALRFWLKLGFISFGGPAGQIAIMHKELVEKRRWLGEERFLHALNFCILLPGPEAHQLAIYIGWLMHRVRGGIVAGVFFVLPSIFILLALSYIYAAYGHVPVIAGVMEGFKPVVVAIVVEALFKIGKRALKREVHFAVAALAFVSIYFLHVSFPLIVLAAGVLGFLGTRFFSKYFSPPPERERETKGTPGSSLLPLAIQDNTEAAFRTRPSRSTVFKILAVGLVLWTAPFAILFSWQGWNSLHTQEYLYFTQAAFVTFGGAYAVLAYVTQSVTTSPFSWLTPAQSIDGLALAETTPGPLIMVLQFVGFMAGWNNPVAGMGQTGSAILGALVTTYVTFLPSFLFIFLGAPYIEYLRGNKLLTGALSGVTAAVVGVILNLGLVFGFAVIAPDGFGGDINWSLAVVSVAAFVALYRFKIDVLWVILAGGIIGLTRTL
ncbi:MAG: chromate efflux transporter [Acidobacteriota bacterium]